MVRKQTCWIIIALSIVLICLSFFIGCSFLVIRLVSWETYITKPPFEWLKPPYNWFDNQYALYFDKDQVKREDIDAFNRVKKILETRYYEEVDFDKLMSSTIKGLASGVGDPYTVYYTPDEMKAFLESSSGNYVGIGVSVYMDEDDLLTVADVFANSPAKEAGILKDDRIVGVDNEDVTKIKDADLIVKKIKGKAGTTVRITIFRPNTREYINLELKRREINIQNISSRIINNNIGYIRIEQFDDDIYKDFDTHLNDLINKGIRGLVIDLRDNPGGDYGQVVRIADRIVPKGIIVYTEDRYKIKNEEYSDERELNMPLSILVNGYSASASEILAACVQDYGKGILVGTKTFGKGLVQAIDTTFENGGGLKYTMARYFTPSGKCIHGQGVIPDVEIQLDEEFITTAIEDIPFEKDNQLQTAVDIVMRNLN
jgi:carboxyl-terminal processing protease